MLEEMAATTTVEGVEEAEDGGNDDVDGEELKGHPAVLTQRTVRFRRQRWGLGVRMRGTNVIYMEEGMECEEDV